MSYSFDHFSVSGTFSISRCSSNATSRNLDWSSVSPLDERALTIIAEDGGQRADAIFTFMSCGPTT